MTQTTYSHVINPLQKWQSQPCMIPVVLRLLKEYYYDVQNLKNPYSAGLHYEIQDIFKNWKNLKNLNPTQQEWLQEIGGYIEALQKKHTIFSLSSDAPVKSNIAKEMEETSSYTK